MIKVATPAAQALFPKLVCHFVSNALMATGRGFLLPLVLPAPPERFRLVNRGVCPVRQACTLYLGPLCVSLVWPERSLTELHRLVLCVEFRP